MSLGLLGAYNSDSDSDCESQEDRINYKEVDTKAKTEQFKNPFIASDDSSDNDEDEVPDRKDGKSVTDYSDAKQTQETLANPFQNNGIASSNWLPKPSFMQETEQISGLRYENSVFSNPFRAKEDKKEAILTQHIDVTSRPEAGKMFNGKKVCYNFRKGRCRHGHKCKFAHDNDVSKAVSDNLYTAKYDEAAQISNEKQETDTRPNIHLVPNIGQDVDVAEDPSVVSISSGKKKRPGLSDGLTPSKKAMKFYNKVYS